MEHIDLQGRRFGHLFIPFSKTDPGTGSAWAWLSVETIGRFAAWQDYKFHQAELMFRRVGVDRRRARQSRSRNGVSATIYTIGKTALSHPAKASMGSIGVALLRLKWSLVILPAGKLRDAVRPYPPIRSALA